MVKNIVKYITFSDLAGWIRKGSYSVIDQGLFSGTNFILNILLARWLAPERYGVFALSFTIYLFFSGFHNAFVLEPMTIFGTAKYQKQMFSYFFSNLKLHVLITCLLGCIMAFVGIGFVIDGTFQELGSAILASGILLPFLLLVWLSRRYFYMINMPSGAAITSTIYMTIVVCGAFVVVILGLESHIVVWYAILALASLVAGILSWLGFRLRRRKEDYNSLPFKSIFLENWHYGKWIVPATILYSIGNQAQIFVSAILLGVESAGVWRVLQNFTLPVQQAITAIATLGLPILAQEFGRGNLNMLRKKGTNLTVLLFLLACGYSMFLYLFAVSLESLLFSGKFSNYVWMVPLFGVLPILTAIESGLGLVLRALQKNLYYLITMGIAAFTGFTLSVVLIRNLGLFGAVQSALYTAVITLFVTLWLYFKWFPKKKTIEITSLDDQSY